MIWMGAVSRGYELLQQPADRIAVGAHPAFLNNNIAFFIEFAHHGMQKPLGFHIGPQLQAIRWKRIVVGGFILIGGSVHAFDTVAVENL